MTDAVPEIERPVNAFRGQANMMDFLTSAQDRGYAYVQRYAIDEAEYGGNFDAKYILSAGLGGSYTTTARTTTAYHYWDGRTMAERPGCVA